MNVARLVEAMESIAPARFAASWDNVGLLVGDPSAPISRILLTIDCTAAVVREAIESGCDAVVSYHPPIFEPRRQFVAGAVAFDLARRGIAVYSPHTALDASAGGTNDVLADVLAMTGRTALEPVVRHEAAASEATGFGRVGSIAPVALSALVVRLKAGLGLDHVLVAGSMDATVSRVAVCAGSGGDLLGAAIASGADALVTGELRHHDVLRATAANVCVVCTRHSASERCALLSLEGRLRQRLPGVEVLRSSADREPLAIV
jgi:dinuclear metal center YbgI/SA1388 family protein